MKLTKITLAAALLVAVAFTSCKPKDADIKAGIETALKADPAGANTKVEVVEGVATLTGECKDAGCKAKCETLAAAVKGVKPPIVNNCTIAPPPPPPPATLTTTLDAATMQKVKDALKDMKSVTLNFAGDKAVLSGEVTVAQRTTIMQSMMNAHVKSDVTKLVTKK